jgi:nitrite reductase/ring-hydroxylating ferredoxin subunit/DMSO/TMAO reductase YedYZ heme-binding membrane subunit
MSVTYAPIKWNRNKRLYDAVVLASVVLYLGTFVALGRLLFRGEHAISIEVLALRALGSCAFAMLQVVLCIGPLARLDRRFLPVLYNRRHLGVLTFGVAFLHGALATGYYHGFGQVNPLVSLLATNTHFGSLRAFPFQLLGLVALVILFLMASTSHDFWNKNLGVRLWKSLHMLVYPAYALIVMHVMLGAVQTQRSIWLAAVVVAGAATVVSLHLATGRRELRIDRGAAAGTTAGGPWVDVCGIEEIADQGGKVVCVGAAERIAVFRYDGRISALANVCAHQGGPIGEGRVINGCVTCPWHGWQYRPEDGRSPPPFQEQIPTYRVQVRDRRVWIDPAPLPPGTPAEPARVVEEAHG